MTTRKWAAVAPAAGVPIPDVVAGLLNDETASAVARAAVREAISRGARVRFLQVVLPGSSAQERILSDEVTFAAALKALRESPRVPVTFEVIEGEPGPAFVERSEEASVLVVGSLADDEESPAAYCQRHARCDLLTVKRPRDSAAAASRA